MRPDRSQHVFERQQKTTRPLAAASEPAAQTGTR